MELTELCIAFWELLRSLLIISRSGLGCIWYVFSPSPMAFVTHRNISDLPLRSKRLIFSAASDVLY